MTYKCISIEDAKTLIAAKDVSLADIRDAGSFLAGNISNSVNVSDHNLEQYLLATDKDAPMIVVCYHGNSSKGAAEYFVSKGYKDVYSLDGGFEEWRQKTTG
jgi:thiosulfate sulfurtransferase